MACWRFELLGGLRATRDGQTLDGLTGRKTGALLGLLALSPGRMRPREEVIDLLWPETEFEEARNRFKQTLAVLRKQLEPDGVIAGSVLVADRMQVGLAAGHFVDVVAFQEALRAGRLQEACALYTGELLPGFYIDALLIERERLAELYRGAQEKLGSEVIAVVAAPIPAATQPLRPTDAFFGRELEREQLAELLIRHRLITILGPGGTGKTRLTQEILSQYPDAHFVPLADLRHGRGIIDAVLATLEVTELSELQGRPLLLALDNLEQLCDADGPEAVAELLNALPAMRLLATSRQRLNLPEEQVFPLAPLSVPEMPGSPERLLEFPAVALFLDRARRVRPDLDLTSENSVAISALCRQLDGLPLAIELAAARSAVLTPVQILQRLERRFDLLADSRRDRSERHRSLRAALDWSHALLSPDLQYFFAMLSVFRGSFSIEATEALTQEVLAVDFLQSLRDASLLVAEETGGVMRFRLLETLREYSSEHLSATERAVLEKRHYDFFLEQATGWNNELSGPGMRTAKTAYRTDLDNLRAAFDRSVCREPREALKLLNKMSIFYDYAYLRRESLERHQRAMKAVPNLEALPYDTRSRLFGTMANLHLDSHENAEAFYWYQKALSVRRQELDAAIQSGADSEGLLPIRRQMAGTLHNIALVYSAQDQLEDAWNLVSEAADINRSIGNDSWLARNLNVLSFLALHRGNPQEALQLCDEGLARVRPLNQEHFLSALLIVRMDVLLALEQEVEALTSLEEGFPLSLELEHWSNVAAFLVHGYTLALNRGADDLAAQLQGAITRIYETWDLGPVNLNSTSIEALTQRIGLPEHTRLYQIGFHASQETLRQLVSRLTRPTPQKIFS
ncbi:MAG: hypothetical protein QM758_25905 [Armatimonas sp.]